MDPTQLTIAEASRAIANGSLSPVALTEAYLDRIAALDGELHSFVLVTRDQALAAARELGASGGRGVLYGIPTGLKDI
jgi:aspartyl-tRNA(Asn)/glutamyl-tRNA(Gln) amidotransferase subunit A